MATDPLDPYVTRLRELMKADPAVKQILQALAKHATVEREVTVDNIQRVIAVDGQFLGRIEAVAALKAMAGAGVGEFINGRRGLPSRFNFLERPHILARLTLGEQVPAAPSHNNGKLPPDRSRDYVEKPVEAREAMQVREAPAPAYRTDDVGQSMPLKPMTTELGPTETFTHVFQLRKNWRLEVDLPADLTEQEAERLAKFMRSLGSDA